MVATSVEITAEEHADYQKAFSEIVFRIRHDHIVGWDPSTPRLLWHYTTGETLIRILKSGSIWMTQVACLNDRSEVALAGIRSREAMTRAQALVPSTDPARILIDAAVKQYVEDEAATSYWFVGCFSERPDDLSQWRAYGGGEGGYALGFDYFDLTWSANNLNARLWPVVYDDARQARIADEVVALAIQFFRQGLAKRPNVAAIEFLEPFVRAIDLYVAELGPLAKDKNFSAEFEWRVIRALEIHEFPRLEFSQKRQMISRHYPLALHNPQSRIDVPHPQPGEKPTQGVVMPALRHVIVGPSPFKERSRISVGALLASVGYPPWQVAVTVSGIPYQSP